LFPKLCAVLLGIVAGAFGWPEVDLQQRLERVGELGSRAVMTNDGRGERMFLVDVGL